MDKPFVARSVVITLAVATSLVAITAGRALPKFDYAQLFTRAGWQLPDQVIHALDIRPGDHVADIGAGDGYFTFNLADAVGPTGTVYAVDGH